MSSDSENPIFVTHTAPPTPDQPQPNDEALADVKQLGLVAAILSLGYVFWIVGAMEMVERLAFYGVRSLAGLYCKNPVSESGLGISVSEYGTILLVWSLFQSVIPILTGGLADRYGYKQTIFASTVIKILGYLTMGLFPSANGFLGGVILLATGTAVFKPGIQGTLVKTTDRSNSSIAWGIFYQTVNIGGFLGPVMASWLRHNFSWAYVFYFCAGVICCNFILLLTYHEPGKEERLMRQALDKASGKAQKSMLADTLDEIKKPHVWTFLGIFSGFYFMFYSLFDVLPIHIDDWVDTHDLVSFLFGTGGIQSPAVKFFLAATKDGATITPEGMLNINAGMIMTTCFLFGYLSSKMRAVNSMVLGTALSSLALIACGCSVAGIVTGLAIVLFSTGEMLSSPKFGEFVGNIAPSDKKAMYLGFSQISVAFGMSLESKVGPALYEAFASKERFAREMLAQKGLTPEDLARLPKGEAFKKLVELTHDTPEHLTQLLYSTHNVGMVWLIMGGIGLLTAAAIFGYGQWVRSRTAKG